MQSSYNNQKEKFSKKKKYSEDFVKDSTKKKAKNRQEKRRYADEFED